MKRRSTWKWSRSRRRVKLCRRWLFTWLNCSWRNLRRNRCLGKFVHELFMGDALLFFLHCDTLLFEGCSVAAAENRERIFPDSIVPDVPEMLQQLTWRDFWEEDQDVFLRNLSDWSRRRGRPTHLRFWFFRRTTSWWKQPREKRR